MGRIEIRICGARNIGDIQKVGMPDPYVKIIMGNDKKSSIKYKTKIVPNNLNPTWNEVAKFQIADYNSAQIVFEVWNDNVMIDDLLGTYRLSVNGLQRGVLTDMWVILSGAKLSSAELHLHVLAVDFGLDPPAGTPTVLSIESDGSTADPRPSSTTKATNQTTSEPAVVYDEAVKKPVDGIPLQAGTPVTAQQQSFYQSPPPPQQVVYQQGPPPPQQVVYVQAPQPQQQVVYVQAPQPQQQVVYMQAPPPQQQVVYMQAPPPQQQYRYL